MAPSGIARLALNTGPFRVRVETNVPAVVDGVQLLYRGYPSGSNDFADFRVSLMRPSGLRRWYRPQVRFECDGDEPFKPLPFNQALPFLEWGMNWAIARSAHRYLIIHAAAIERGNRVAILPGQPGAGKSTLTAVLVNRGWRLLSDELTLLSLDATQVTALARPINLKNDSIEIVGNYVEGAVFSPKAHDTVKGTVALMRAPEDSIARVEERGSPAWVIFPQYSAGAAPTLTACSRAEAFMEIADNAFNYSIHGKAGFDALGALINRTQCLRFNYSKLDDAVETFAKLADH